MSIWIAIALLTAVWGLASLSRDIRDENKLQITLDIALIILGAMALGMYLAEIVRRCNAAHSPDITMFISHISDIANN